MNTKEKKKILSIVNKIDKLRAEIIELVGDEQAIEKNKTSPDSNTATIYVKSIAELSTEEMENQLQKFSHKELGNIFVEVGGSGGDKRKPKAWLIERILWLAKEFIEGHKAIRDQK